MKHTSAATAIMARRRAEKAVLWGAITVLGAPFGFAPAMAASLARQQNRHSSRRRDALHLAETGGFTACEDAAPLSILCREIAEKGGVTIDRIFIKPGEDIRNAMMLAYRSDEAFLYFYGDPEAKGFLVENSAENAILRGMIAHEVSHAQTPNSVLYRFQTFTTTSLYLAGSSLIGAAGAAGLALGASTLSVLGWIGTAAAGFVTGVALPALSQRFSRNEEYLADLRGAALAGPDAVIDCLTYMQQHEQADAAKEEEKREQNPQGTTNPGNAIVRKIINLCAVFYGYEHPDTETRIQTLRTAFNRAANPAAELDGKKSSPTPPPPAP